MARKKKDDDVGVAIKLDPLRKALSFVLKLSSAAHGTVKLDVGKGLLEVSSGNVVGAASAMLEIEDEQAEFACTFQGDSLSRVVKELKGSDVRLSAEHVLVCGKSRMRLKEEAVNFNKPTTEALAPGVLLDREALKACLGAVRYAVSTDNDRPHIACVALQATKKELIATATNGHRLARRSTACKSKRELKTLLPRDALSAIATLLDLSTSETIEVKSKDRVVELEALEPFTMTLQLRADPFVDFPMPAVEGFMREEVEGVASEREALLDAVGRAALVGTPVVLRSNAAGTLLVGASTDRGEAQEEIEAEGSFAGERAFSAAYLREAVSNAEGKLRVDFGAADLDPMRLADDAGYCAVVMPVRV